MSLMIRRNSLFSDEPTPCSTALSLWVACCSQYSPCAACLFGIIEQVKGSFVVNTEVVGAVLKGLCHLHV